MLAPLASRASFADAEAQLRALEKENGGRLGVAARDLKMDARVGWRADERFPICSTFKLLAATATLERADHGKEPLDRPISYGPDNLQRYAPVTKAHLREGHMTLGALTEAAMVISDNTATNLIVEQLGGPESLTRWLRAHGDFVTRIDRWEPAMSSSNPGDPRDTTSPRAMIDDLGLYLFGSLLAPASRAMLQGWLVQCQTGLDLIRSRIPKGGRAGDKTGHGDYGTVNDVAVIWPPRGGPLLVAVYYTGSAAPDATLRDTVARAGEIAIVALARS